MRDGDDSLSSPFPSEGRHENPELIEWPMIAKDLIGKRGETIAREHLLDFCGNPSPYFDPHPLGEKCPTFDFLVELVGAGTSTPGGGKGGAEKGNSATRPMDKCKTWRGHACLDVAISLDRVTLFDIVPTVTDLLRGVVLPLHAIWHNTDIPNSTAERISRPDFHV